MKVLVACEFSGIVRDAFVRRGHDAWSCDLMSTEKPGNHIQGDVLEVLNDRWDLMIAHPPCTYFAKAGLHYLRTRPGREQKQSESFCFLLKLWSAPIIQICLENPAGWLNTNWLKPSQIIQPFYFGDLERKETCLWLKGLSPLLHTKHDTFFSKKTHTETPKPKGSYIRKSGKKKGQIYNYYWRAGKTSKNRSVTFQGIANAMAEQWG